MLDIIGGPPSRKILKQHFLDAQRREHPNDAINCAAHLILNVDDPEKLIDVGLEFIAGKLSACRADAGFMRPDDAVYEPLSVFYNPRSAPPRCDGVVYPNKSGVFRRAWRQSGPVACDDVGMDPVLQDSRELFHSIQSRSIMFQRLSVQRKPVGMVCIDFTHDRHVWTSAETEFVRGFCEVFLGPLAWISHEYHGPRRGSGTPKPSRAELEVIKLAARGLSYKAMADALGKSVRTIENQLHQARVRLGAANQAELIGKCELWL